MLGQPPWWSFHYPWLGWLRPKGKGRHEISPEVNGEDLHHREGQRNTPTAEGKQDKGHGFWGVAREDIHHEFSYIGIHCSPFLHGIDNRSEVIIGQDHVSG